MKALSRRLGRLEAKLRPPAPIYLIVRPRVTDPPAQWQAYQQQHKEARAAGAQILEVCGVSPRQSDGNI